MKRIVKIAALAAMVLALAGCKGRNRGPLLPNVSGKAGEIVVVIDKDNWEGEIGNALRGILADDCAPTWPSANPCSTWRMSLRAASTTCSRCTGTSSS